MLNQIASHVCRGLWQRFRQKELLLESMLYVCIVKEEPTFWIFQEIAILSDLIVDLVKIIIHFWKNQMCEYVE